MKSGQDVLQGNDPAIAAQLRDVILMHAYRARSDINAFVNFVMREETTRKPIVIAPHHKVLLNFILSHDRSVNVLPVGTGKTFTMASLTLFLMGQNPTLRGAVVSATQGQASKVVGMVRDYIESSEELKLVFPHLRKSERGGDTWTQTEITVDRPAGIRDASLLAVGVDGAIAGARLNWIIVDDILDRENTNTKEQRDKVYEWFDSSVLSRLDPKGARLVVTNTAWHPDDLVHRLEALGWATLRMDVLGGITVRDDVDRLREEGSKFVPWDSDELRPADKRIAYVPSEASNCRLAAHDPDPTNSVPLWPYRYDHSQIAKLKRNHLPYRFNQLYMGVCRDDDSSMCKQEFIDLCKRLARERRVYSMSSTQMGQNPLTFTGVDLAVSPGEEHDDTAFFTFEVLPDGIRQILDVEIGQWDGPTIIKKLKQKQRQFNSVVRIENNAAQDYLRQFALEKDKGFPIKAHTTGRVKAHPEYGVPGLFIELANGAWLIPNDRNGICHPFVQKWIDACLYYSPSKHTDDVLMACVAPGAPVTTQRGLIAIENVQAGDRVLTHRGRWRTVEGVTQRPYKGEALRIKPCGSPSFVVTPNHPIWASAARIETETRKNRVIPSNAWDFIRADEVKTGPMVEGHFLEHPVPETDREWRRLGSAFIDADLAFLIGLYIAEGSTGGTCAVQIAIHERETHLGEFFKQAMQEKFNATVKVRKGTGKGVIWTAWSKEAFEAFKIFGANDKKSLPWDWMRLSLPFRDAMVRGWLMGDGCYSSQKGTSRLSGVSISRGWLEQVRTTLWQSGHLPTLNVFEKGGRKQIFGTSPSLLRRSWKLQLSQFDTVRFLAEMTPLEREHWGDVRSRDERHGTTDRTNTRMLSQDGRVFTRATKIERVPYDGLVFNMHVEEDESYCVEGVAVHNCYFAREQAKEWGVLTGSQTSDMNSGGNPSISANIMSR